MKNSIKSITVLVCICAAVSVLLALTNSITAPIIRRNENKNASAALLEVLPEGGTFEPADISALTLPKTVTEVYKAENGGHVVKLNTAGYNSGMIIMCGILPDGTVSGTKLVASSETPSIGGAAAESFASLTVGNDITTVDSIDTVAGATKTTAAYRSAVKDALNTVIILQGGSVDIRSEEEILADNLSAALSSAEGSFTKHFFVEAVDGVDAIYLADNNTGAVCVIGDKYIGIDDDGKVITECTEVEAQAAKDAIGIILSTVTEDIDISAYQNLPSQLVSASRTASGNYVFEIKAAGYGIVGGNEYHPASGEYIFIRVSISAEGKIIDCLTLSQAETDGLGAECAKEAFYGQFDGKTEENYSEVDAISGATLTTDGYKKAVERAFKAFNIIKEGLSQ